MNFRHFIYEYTAFYVDVSDVTITILMSAQS